MMSNHLMINDTIFTPKTYEAMCDTAQTRNE